MNRRSQKQIKDSYKLIRKYPGAIEHLEFKARLWNIGKQDRLNAFLNHFKLIFPLVPRKETAKLLGMSRKYLRRQY